MRPYHFFLLREGVLGIGHLVEEGLTLETSDFKLFTVVNTVVNTKLPVILSHRHSTTVSLETYLLYSFIFN